MKCTIATIGGAPAFLCGSGKGSRTCWRCRREAGFFCDAPSRQVGKKTCDRPMCELHRTNVAPNRDICGPCTPVGGVATQEALL